MGTFCARRVFELALERGVRDLEVTVAVVEIYREGKVGARPAGCQLLPCAGASALEAGGAGGVGPTTLGCAGPRTVTLVWAVPGCAHWCASTGC